MYLTEEKIIYHGRSSPYRGKLKKPTVSYKIENSMCGDSLKIYAKIVQNNITDISFTGEGCLISQASASLLVEEAKRIKDINKIKQFDEKTVFRLLGFKPTFSRIKCATLALQALHLHQEY